MFRFVKNVTAAVVLTGLVVAQPAMAVRSSESLPSPDAKVISGVHRASSHVRKAEEVTGVPAFGFVLAGGITIAALILMLQKNNDSPG